MPDNNKGFHTQIESDHIHDTVYTTDGTNMRYSRDMDEDGNLTNRHIVDQDDNSILNLDDCKVEDDDIED